MYIIKKISVDDKLYLSSQIICHTQSKISSAIELFEKTAREFVGQEFGRDAYEKSKIIDIHNLDQIAEPLIDGMLLYRLYENPNCIYVYQRKTIITKQSNWTWGTTDIITSQFKRTHLFEMEEYEDIEQKMIFTNSTSIPSIEMVSIGSSHIRIPKPMTVSPICDLIEELKNCQKFKARYQA